MLRSYIVPGPSPNEEGRNPSMLIDTGMAFDTKESARFNPCEAFVSARKDKPRIHCVSETASLRFLLQRGEGFMPARRLQRYDARSELLDELWDDIVVDALGGVGRCAVQMGEIYQMMCAQPCGEPGILKLHDNDPNIFYVEDAIAEKLGVLQVSLRWWKNGWAMHGSFPEISG